MLPATMGEITDGMIKQRDEEALQEPLVEEVMRQQQPEQELHRQRHRGDCRGVQHRAPKALVLEQAAVVQQALEVGVLIEQAQLLEADDHRVEERKQTERQKDEHGRRDQQVLETAGADAAGGSGHWRRRGDRRRPRRHGCLRPLRRGAAN